MRSSRRARKQASATASATEAAGGGAGAGAGAGAATTTGTTTVDMQEQVTVVIRMRPFAQRDLEAGSTSCVSMSRTGAVVESRYSEKKVFAFDRCFDSSNPKVCHLLQQFLLACMVLLVVTHVPSLLFATCCVFTHTPACTECRLCDTVDHL